MSMVTLVLRRLLGPEARERLVSGWAGFWMRLAGARVAPRTATRLASLAVPPYYGRHRLRAFHLRGHTAPSATIHHRSLRRGDHTSLAERVIVFEDEGGGTVTIGDRSTVNHGVCIQTGQGGRVTIGADTHIQPWCQLSAYVGAIEIGDGVDIAPGCSFYPYDHAMEPGRPIRDQGLVSRGDIVVGDGALVGTHAILLSGAKVGNGAVIAAGAVVRDTVPDGAIAAGVPARVVGTRSGTSAARHPSDGSRPAEPSRRR